MEGISGPLLSELYKTLGNCGVFQSAESLQSLFVDTRISIWRDQLPTSNTISERMRLAVNFLYWRENDRGENGLILFLQALLISLQQEDANYNGVKKLIGEIQASITIFPDGNHQDSPKQFTNREDEICMISSSVAPPYCLIDAPVGYGKTELLKVLKARFDESGWWCAYVNIREDATMSIITKALAQELGVDIETTDPMLPLGRRLGSALHRQWNETKRSLIMFLDLDKKLMIPILEELVQELIPTIYETLQELQRSKRSFRVIIAGRYVAAQPQIRQSKIPLHVISLKPFKYNVVRQYVWEALSGDDRIDDVTAHFMDLTGGHPGCIVSVLKKYKRGWTPNDLPGYARRIWEDDIYLGPGIYREAQKIYDEIPGPDILRECIVRLSVFRYLNFDILEKFTDIDIPKINTAVALYDILIETYLFKIAGRWIKDDIARRLLALRFRNTQPNAFKDLCEQAKSICLEQLHPLSKELEIWAMEYLFQCLQAYAGNAQTLDQRVTIRNEFWDVNVPCVLQRYFGFNDLSKIREEKNALICKIESDWEFQFMVNYYLRERQYTTYPCEQLLQIIADFKM